MSQNYRLDNIGLINRDKKLSFKFNGVTYFGYEGDTLASALIANGVHLIGRSFNIIDQEVFLEQGLMNLTQLFNCIEMEKQNLTLKPLSKNFLRVWKQQALIAGQM